MSIARRWPLQSIGPDREATRLFEREEGEAAYLLNKQKPPQPPRLHHVIRLIARLGGFFARKRDGEPGMKTIGQDMQRVIDFAAGLRFARALQTE